MKSHNSTIIQFPHLMTDGLGQAVGVGFFRKNGLNLNNILLVFISFINSLKMGSGIGDKKSRKRIAWCNGEHR